jgi:BlaI family penicillinase repressor
MGAGELGELQLTVMKVLWARGRGSVHEVLDALPADPAPAYTTVLTVLRNLERRGLVTHDPVPGSRMFAYRPLVTPQEARTERLHELLYHWYESSPLLLIKHLIHIGELTDEERAELRLLLVEPGDEPEAA